ncbi:hypothetical protein Pan2_89 [Pseudanabaena phage Pan2]|nr:hypothetical protein Pan2_89 [Pseudanabaena phage Pan2]
MTNIIPTGPGKLVQSEGGSIGITTSDIGPRTGRIGVMFIGGSWEVSVNPHTLVCIDPDTL